MGRGKKALYCQSPRRYGAKMTYSPNLRTPPHGIGRWMALAPRYLYRLGLGRLLGRRLVLLEHRGRRTGTARQTVLEVVDADEKSLFVAAAWGSSSDWFQNVAAEPSVVVSSGSMRQVPAQATVVAKPDAARVFKRYVAAHPKAARVLAKTFHLPFGDANALAEMVPMVRLKIEAGQ